MIGFLIRTAVTIAGAEYVRYRVTSWWKGQPEVVTEQIPRPETLCQDALTGEFVPETQVVRRRIDGIEYHFASIESYVRFRSKRRTDQLGEMSS